MNDKQKEMTRNDEIKEEHEKEVTAKSLKAVLWEAIGDLKRKRIKPEEAGVLVKAANGILSTIKLEVEVGKMLGGVSTSLTEFAYSKDMKVITKTDFNGDTKAYQTLKTIEEPKGH